MKTINELREELGLGRLMVSDPRKSVVIKNIGDSMSDMTDALIYARETVKATGIEGLEMTFRTEIKPKPEVIEFQEALAEL